MKNIFNLILALFIIVGFVFLSAGNLSLADSDGSSIDLINDNLIIPFVPNAGQFDKNVIYSATASGLTFCITSNGALTYLSDNIKISEIPAGNRKCSISATEQSNTGVNFIKGKDNSDWKLNLPTYKCIDMGEVFPGVNLKLRASSRNIEKILTVNPGSDVNSIRFRVSDPVSSKIDEGGILQISQNNNSISFTKPIAYQNYSGEKKYIEASYVIDGNEYGFSVGDYNAEKELIIDPLISSTYLGGSDSEGFPPISIALDNQGYVYVAGYTNSPDFPTTPDAYDTLHSGSTNDDIFISKFDNDLSTLISSTFIGGSGDDICGSMFIDDEGSIYLTGRTRSSNFPITPNAYDPSYNSAYYGEDVFALKIDSDLTTLGASTYLGGTGVDQANSIILDGAGNVLIGGCTLSSNFPTTSGAYDTL